MVVHALGACRPECPWCAREWWRWYKSRMAAMAQRTGSNGRTMSASFAEAAATSIRPPK